MGDGDEFSVGKIRLRLTLPAASPPAGGEIDLESGEEPPPPQPAPAAPAPPPPPPAPDGVRRLGGDGITRLKVPPRETGPGGLLGEDLGQWSGPARILAWLVVLAAGAGLFWLVFTLVGP